MTIPEIPYDRWEPLLVAELVASLRGAPFTWGLAGGYAVEQFLGRPIRAHDDIDIVVFRDQQLRAQEWLAGWELYAADPPGSLRPWRAGEQLRFGIHDIWGHRAAAQAWQLQIMLLEAEGDAWFSRRDPRVRGRRADLIVDYGGLPCILIEVQLLYKARGMRPKDVQDFQACLPLLSAGARAWLRDQLQLLHPDGHPWIARLA